MFAFSAFGQGPHTEYYFILQGKSGGTVRGGALEDFWVVIVFDYSKSLFKTDQVW